MIDKTTKNVDPVTSALKVQLSGMHCRSPYFKCVKVSLFK